MLCQLGLKLKKQLSNGSKDWQENKNQRRARTQAEETADQRKQIYWQGQEKRTEIFKPELKQKK